MLRIIYRNRLLTRLTILVFALVVHTQQLQSMRSSGSDTVKLGSCAFGGIVFWLDSSGCHGLVCAKSDQICGIYWSDIYRRNENNLQNPANPKPTYNYQEAKKDSKSDTLNLAMKVCHEYSVEQGGVLYIDWRLPSKEELYLMYKNKILIETSAIKNGGTRFKSNDELNPTEYCNDPSWDQIFNYVYSDYEYKNSKFNVRAVRSF